MAYIGAQSAYNYVNITASTLVKGPQISTQSGGSVIGNPTQANGDGQLGGIFVSAASATPTITVYDNSTASTTGAATIVSVFTPTAATWYPLPFAFTKGLYIVISGTVACTVAYL